jgi:hypothetical protein
MKSDSKVTQDKFDALLSQYVRQISKTHHLPKEIGNQLLRQISNQQDKVPLPVR